MSRRAIVASPLLLLLANGSAETLDCARATKAPATVLCADPLLSALEKEAARLAELAGAGTHMTAAGRRELVASNASFRKTLRACGDVKPCLQRALIEHIHGLRQGYPDARTKDGEGISQGPKVLACFGLDALIAITFVNGDPAFAFLAWRDKALVLTRTTSDPGAPYSGSFGTSRTQLSTKEKQATLDLPGKPTLTCDLQEGG
jgi:uncharacterized protein